RTLCGTSALCLHAALPIFGGGVALATGAAAQPSRRVAARRPCVASARSGTSRRGSFLFRAPDAEFRHRRFSRDRARLKVALEPRSEEHTSELQSRENLVCR